MQCKARRRPCSFSKDGSLEDMVEETSAFTEANESFYSTSTSSSTPNVESGEEEERKNQHEEKERRKRTIHILNTLEGIWPGNAREGDRKRMQMDLLRIPRRWDPETETDPSLASVKINRQLLSLFFRHHYVLFPLVPKRLFYDQLDTQGPLITPLLLYSMYAHGAQFSEDDEEWYFGQAKSCLDSSLDRPRLSTILALCLLSLYESKQTIDHRCRSSLYSSMAFRMAAELGLFRGYLYQSADNSAGYDMELLKRVSWSCYCLDKMQNLITGQPWCIRSRDIALEKPQLQSGDDVTEHEVLEGFVACIELMQLCERGLQQTSFQPMMRHHEDEQKVLNLDNEFVKWLRSLQLQLQWTPSPSQNNTLPREPPPNAIVAHLHLLYNLATFSALQPYAVPSSKVVYQRCASAATNLTQLVCSMAHQTKFILSYALVAHAAMVVVPVHVSNCNDKDTRFANHARFMFQRTLQGLRQLVERQSIPGVERFALSLEQAFSVVNAADGDLAAFGNEPNHKPSWSKVDYFGPEMKASPKQQAELASLYLNGTEQDAAEVLSCFSSPNGWKSSLDRISRNPLDFLSVDSGWPNVEKTEHEMHTSTADAYLFRTRSLMIPEDKSSTRSAADLLIHHQQKVNDTSSLTALIDSMPNGNHTEEERRKNGQPNTKHDSPWSENGGVTHSDALLYSLWPNQQRQDRSNQGDAIVASTAPQPQPQPPAPQPVQSFYQYQPSYMNIGLGVYASAHQHRNDVISQHFPLMDTRSNPSVRPVILTHQGQVIVAGTNPPTTQSGQPPQ
ncbi:hypothetical protein EC973_008365 [Apophysomyces ossiformis]|uniref:Xylanolytic transcriptional activator regulatory domain-containing protein n=1 Tax=Apophysomyces ossiformis TaxID=679940 RepID=A0A8H7EQD4_9FUNG|nr:hypothetical protein EC973_008365 [Apophysomyces ossiformis]